MLAIEHRSMYRPEGKRLGWVFNWMIRLLGARKRFRLEFYLLRDAQHMDIGFTRHHSEGEITIFWSIYWLFCFYFTFSFKGNYTGLETDRRTLSASIHHGKFWLRLWGDETDSRYDRLIVIDPERILFGRERVNRTPLNHNERVVLKLPEGNVFADVEWERLTRQWSRWPFTRDELVYSLTPDEPVSIGEGDGENDWDMGDDYIFSTGGRCQESRPGQVIADEFVKYVIAERARRD